MQFTGDVRRSLVALQSETTTAAGAAGGGSLVDAAAAFAGSTAGRVLGAVLVLALGAYLSKYVVRLIGRTVARRFARQSVAQTVLRSVRLVVVFLSVLAAMHILNIEVGNIVLSVTVFSAVLGLVLAPIVGSIVNGLFVLADQPYEIGDMIELDDGRRGFVDEITIRYTKIFTLENSFLVIPNSAIRERDVMNYSAEDERTRLTLPLLVTYESDIGQARRIMERAARACDDVIEGGPDIRIGSARYPAKPTCYIGEYADHGVLLQLRYWAHKPYRIPSVESNVRERVWDLLDDADVEVAYPHQHLVFDETSGQARVAIERDGDRGADRTGTEGDAEAPARRPAADADSKVDPDADGSPGPAE